MSRTIISTNNAPGAIGPYNQAVLANNTLYVSGQIALDPKSGNLVQSSIQEETHQVLKNMTAILEESGMSLSDVVKCSVFVNDMNQYAQINDVYAEYFDADNAPARELVEVANLPKFVNIEISCIAVK